MAFSTSVSDRFPEPDSRVDFTKPSPELFPLSDTSQPASEKPKRGGCACLFRLMFLPFAVVGAVLIASNVWVVVSTYGRVYESVESVPANAVGIVLGTSKKVAPDQENPHFENRLDAAAKLYESGKVRHLLVSGHREEYYDEPRDMTKGLVERGVPATAITPDVAGHRTLDSIVRAHEVYGLEQMTVISDDFHVPRALFIADRKGIEAVALHGEAVGFEQSLHARLREYFARVKAVIDLYLLDTQPADLGEPQEILVQRES